MPEEATKVHKAHGLINRNGVRRFLLDHAARTRAHRFTRVAPDVFIQLEGLVREQCRRLVHSQPSVGRTIR
jgi:hypothetical protein